MKLRTNPLQRPSRIQKQRQFRMEQHLAKTQSEVESVILGWYDEARKIVARLENPPLLTKAKLMLRGLKSTPAAELSEKQKQALYLLAGFLKYDDGKLVSIRPVGISDRGDGGYIVSISPESDAN